MTSKYNISVYKARAYDPTKTSTIRNAFVKDLKRRFKELKEVINRAILVQNVFGFTPDIKPVTFQLVDPMYGQFDFPRSADKVKAFMDWLRIQIDRGLLETKVLPQSGESIEQVWANLYISDSYVRGVQRARYEMKRGGMKVPELPQGSLTATLGTPFHADRLGLIYSRVYSDLKGITDTMDAQISKVLAQGIGDGLNPRTLASKLVKTIEGGDLSITDTLGRFIPAERRAEILARTEVIRAHHKATLQEYRNWGLEGVKVKAEWTTAQDGRVCDECLALEGQVFTLDEIENKIPLHPQCRCIALPLIQEDGNTE